MSRDGLGGFHWSVWSELDGAAPHPIEAHRVDALATFCTSIGDGKEGVRAFLEKRNPAFTAHV